MAKHISELNIETFRGIKDLSIKNIGDVNILVGANNSGKTSVLEIIRSLENPDSIRKWSIISRRDIDPFYRDDIFDSISFLSNANEQDGKILFDTVLHDEQLEISIIIKTEELELSKKEMHQIIQRKFPKKIDYIRSDNLIDENKIITGLLKLTMSFFINNSEEKQAEIYNFYVGNFITPKNPPKINVTYISPTQHIEDSLYLTNVFDNPELYVEMLNILKEFDEGIISINAAKDSNKFTQRVIYKILSKENKIALPLNLYGDGMKRAILLMSAVVVSKNGILLIDEFETALHTTAMSKVYKWILDTCKKLNVQLFMTTHSIEALDKLLESSGENIDDLRVIRLKKKNDKTMSKVILGREALDDRKTYDMELRV